VKWPGTGSIRLARDVAVIDAPRTPQCGFETVLVGLDRDCETVIRFSELLEDGVGMPSLWSLREWGGHCMSGGVYSTLVFNRRNHRG
jgi:hypothetical protein